MDFVLGAAVQYFLHLATARALAYPTSDPTNLPNNEDTFFLVAEEILSAFVLGLVVYFVLRRFYPVVARGSGYATLLLLAVLLGALFICQPVTY